MSKTQEPKKKRRKFKLRFLILHLIALVLIAFSFFYVDIVGDRYEMHANTFVNASNLKDVSVDIAKEGIVRVSDIRIDDNGELIVALESESQGETEVDIQVKLEGEPPNELRYANITVTPQGTIIEHSILFTNFNGYELVTYLFLGFIATTIAVTLYSFFECYKKCDYSYSMVAYGGVTLFLSVMLVIVIYKRLNNVVNSFSALITLLTQTGEWFLILLMPLMLVMAVALSVSNIWLLRHEGFRPVNALGIALSVVWLLGLGFSLNTRLFSGWLWDETELTWHIRNVMTFVVTYFECMLLSTAACAFISTRHTPPLDRDYIIILGCAIRRDGSLTPLLRGRADSALDFEKKQFEATGKHARFVPSGGQGADEVISESEAMARYLIEQGVEPERIVREDKSVNTNENMRFSRDRIAEDAEDFEDQKIAFSTTNYHIFRGYILANKNGYHAEGISAKTKWYFFPNAFIREFIGLLYDKKLHHFMLLVAIALIVVGVFYVM